VRSLILIDGEENNESRHLDSYIKTRRGGDGGEGGSAVPAERSGRAAGGSADCPNPQRVDRQKRVRNSPMPLCLAERCELGQLAVREKAARRGRRRRHSAAPAERGGREAGGMANIFSHR
jgi:hypothetical protein